MAEGTMLKECSNFLDTFEVLVGTALYQKRFTVYRDIAIKRSRFFRAARSRRWTPETKPTDLHQYDPDTFNRYLHCLYHNEVPDIPPLVIADEDHKNQSFAQFVVNDSDCQFEHLIKLYVLANSLMDPLTANMAVAEIRSFGLKDGYCPGGKVIQRVFRSTRDGDGLRNLLADWYIYNPYVEFDGDFPKAFLLLVLQRFQRAKLGESVTFDEDDAEMLQSNSPYTLGEYFQQLEESPE